MRFIALCIRLLPRWLVYGISWIPVWWYAVVRRDGAAASDGFQRRIDPRSGPLRRFAFRLGQARAFSHVILDNMYLGLLGAEGFRLKQYGTELFTRALRRGRGLILISAHVGNWHLAVNFLSNVETTVHLVIDDARQAEVKRQMDRAKTMSAHLVIRQAKQEGLIFELRQALQRGEVVVLAGDRVIGERRSRLAFFGGRAWFPTTAYYLAAIARAPVCTAFSFRTGVQRYNCYGYMLFDGRESTRSDRNQLIDAMARRFADHLETHVHCYPRQWFNFYDFWSAE